MFNDRLNPNRGPDPNRELAENLLAELRNLVAYQPTTFENGSGSNHGEAEIAMTADKLLSEVLGGHIRPDDTRALQAALDHVFAFHDVEGRRELSWQQPSYAVQTELGIELTGARASFYAYAQTQAEEVRKRIRILRSPVNHADEDRMEAARAGWLIELDDLMSALGRSTPLRPLEIDGAMSRLDHYTARARQAFGVDRQSQNENIQSPEDARIVSEFETAMRYQNGIFDAWRDYRQNEQLQRFTPPPIALDRDIRGVEVPMMLMHLTPLLAALAQNVRQDLIRGLDALAFSDGDRAVTELDYLNAYGMYRISIGELTEWLLRFSRTKAPHLFQAAGRVSIPAVKAEAILLHQLVTHIQHALPPLTLSHPRIRAALTTIRDILNRIVDTIHRVAPSQVDAYVNGPAGFRSREENGRRGGAEREHIQVGRAARFAWHPEIGTLSIRFENLSEDGGYIWEFGDGAVSFDRQLVHEYPATGIYTVTLHYTNVEGEVYITQEGINVTDAVPEEQQQEGINVADAGLEEQRQDE